MPVEGGTARLVVLLESTLERGDGHAVKDDDDGIGVGCLLFDERRVCGGERADENG